MTATTTRARQDHTAWQSGYAAGRCIAVAMTRTVVRRRICGRLRNSKHGVIAVRPETLNTEK